MRVASLGVARPSNYDRNSSSIIAGYDATVGPHTNTLRISYTVPAGRKALMENLYVRVSRNTAATVAGTVYVLAKVYTGVTETFLTYPVNFATVAGSIYSDRVNSGITIYAAESVKSYTTDGSTGGDNLYVIALKATEFDA